MELFSSGKKQDQSDIPGRPPDAPPAGSSPTPVGAEGPDFSLLARNLRNTGSRDDMDRLWKAVYDLPQWLFVLHPREWSALEEPPGGRHPQAYKVRCDGKPFLMAFTDDRMAYRFARENNLLNPNGEAMTIGVPFEGAIRYAWNHQTQSIFGILFNGGDDGFFAPLANLIPMYEWFKKRSPDWAPKAQPAPTSSFDRLVRAYRAMNSEIGVRGLYSEILTLPGWYFLCDKDRPKAPHVWMLDTGPCLLAFSDEVQVAMGADRFHLRNPDGTLSTLQLPILAVVDWLPSFQKNGVETVLFNGAGESSIMEIPTILDLARGIKRAQ